MPDSTVVRPLAQGRGHAVIFAALVPSNLTVAHASKMQDIPLVIGEAVTDNSHIKQSRVCSYSVFESFEDNAA